MLDSACSTSKAFPCGRMTRQRRIIASTVAGLRNAFTVDDLAIAVRRTDPHAGSSATLYRAVAAMEASGFVTRVGTRNGRALYARCDSGGHHHHIVCDSCGRIAEADCPFPSDAIAAAGFRVMRHEVTLYGLCPQCAQRSAGI